MTFRSVQEHLRWMLIVALAGLTHLFLLCFPLAFVEHGWRIARTPKMVIFLMVISVWCLTESKVAGTEARRPLKTQGPRWLPLAIGLALLATFWTSIIEHALSHRSPIELTTLFGVILTLIGIALRCISLRTLGSFFLNEIAILPTQPLITTGIYRSLRHPSELGTICLAIGGSIVLGSLSGLVVCTLLLVPGILWRTRLEDGILRMRHTSEFDHYAKEVPAFLPRQIQATIRRGLTATRYRIFRKRSPGSFSRK